MENLKFKPTAKVDIIRAMAKAYSKIDVFFVIFQIKLKNYFAIMLSHCFKFNNATFK